jgi:hypothetical protein
MSQIGSPTGGPTPEGLGCFAGDMKGVCDKCCATNVICSCKGVPRIPTVIGLNESYQISSLFCMLCSIYHLDM